MFEAWLVDDFYKGSGYVLSIGKILNSGTLRFHENTNNARTYTDIVVIQEPVLISVLWNHGLTL